MKESTLIEQKEFFQKINDLSYFTKKSNLAVAVSGGADSLCLSILLKQYCDFYDYNLTAIIIDHKLRKESTNEALYVQSLLKIQNIKSVILTRDNIYLVTRTQEIARNDRYKLLCEYCKENYISHLFVGHHFNDQLETVIMRSEKGKNLLGDAGISAKIITPHVILLRPLLCYSKQQIIRTLSLYTDKWVEDPSNCNIKYDRVKVRQKIKATNEYKDYKVKIVHNIDKRIEFENQALLFLSKFIIITKLGIVRICYKNFSTLSHDMQLYILGLILKFVSEKYYRPKLKSLSYVIDSILSINPKRRTLSHCIILRIKEEIIVIPEDVSYSESKVKLPIYSSFKTIMHENKIKLNDAKYFYRFTCNQLYNYISMKNSSLFANKFAKI